MDHETEVIKQQMLETRTSLTEKLEALEEQVASTVRDTTEAVTDTAEAVKEAVEDTVGSVTGSVKDTVESVKETFDLRRQMENHPWLMLGGAVALGYLGGRLLSGSAPSLPSQPSFSGASPSPARQPLSGSGQNPSTSSGTCGTSGMVNRLTEAFQPTMNKLEGLAIGAVTSVVGEMLLNAAPEMLRKELRPMFDEFTSSLGGKPLHGLWNEFMAGQQGQQQGQDQGQPQGGRR